MYVYVYEDVHTVWSHGTRESLTTLDQKGKDRRRRLKFVLVHARHTQPRTHVNVPCQHINTESSTAVLQKGKATSY